MHLRCASAQGRSNICPAAIVWSGYSQPFRIAPWYENGKGPPVHVALPDVLKPGALEKVKPNVAFSVPNSLFNFLHNNDAKDLMDGDGTNDQSGMSLDWICGFNIPIITLCAFIVLSIFLVLLHLIFWWLPFVRICIPLPRRSN